MVYLKPTGDPDMSTFTLTTNDEKLKIEDLTAGQVRTLLVALGYETTGLVIAAEMLSDDKFQTTSWIYLKDNRAGKYATMSLFES